MRERGEENGMLTEDRDSWMRRDGREAQPLILQEKTYKVEDFG